MVLFETAFNFDQTIDYLVQIGVYDVLLPFLLIFSIIFAILEKTSILGKDKRNINVIVAIVIGLLLIVQKGIVEIINIFLPRVSLIIVVILMGLLVISMVAGKEFTGLKGGVLGFAILLIIIALVIALAAPASGTGSTIWLSPSDRQALISIGLPLLILFLVIGIVTAEPKKEKKNYLKELAKGFGGAE